MRTLACLILAALILAICSGCNALRYPEVHAEETISGREDAPITRLEADLSALLGYRDEETHRLARTLLSGTDTLVRRYRVQPPALWHNFLVNIGLRARGLCCHWTQDLLEEVKTLQLRHYQALWGVSRYGTWREHSCIVVTANGQNFEKGLVLDPWRNAGQLFWIRVEDDAYPWYRHPGDNGFARIRCR
jgi:hypothetical protein